MRVLILFERSGAIRDAFAALGHDAWSCDLYPSETVGKHIQNDAFAVLNSDMFNCVTTQLIIMHPPCTALAVSGNAHYAQGTPGWRKRIKAVSFADRLRIATDAYSRVCLENPVGVLPTMSTWGKASQWIQPYQYGHAESKRTGLWLRNLPRLVPTNVLPLPERGYWDNQTPSGQNKLGPSADRAMLRARTYSGIAAAMAEQWGAI